MVVSAATGSSKLSVTLPTDRQIVLARDFNAPRRLVFEAWTKPEHVRQWWAGCEENALTVCEIDLRVGGAWRFVVRRADGKDYPFRGVYREILAPERLVHTQVFDVEAYADSEALVSVIFEDRGGRTRMTETILHPTKEARDAHLQSGMETGATESLDRLDEIVQGLSAATPPLKTTAAAAGKGSYASVNGLEMYYETHGSGRPLVLLHGGLNTIETSFGSVLPYFAATRKVIAVEQQAHGHTPDIDRPLTFDQMAADTAALLEQLGLERADFFGYSVGGTVALQIAIRHPTLVRKLVLASAIYALDGYQPAVAEGLRRATAETMPSAIREAYEKVAPRPEDWPRLVAKMARLATDFKGYAPTDLRSVNAPTLVMTGDADVVRLEHTVELARLTRGQLAVLPGANHFSYLIERPDWLLAMISTFLDTPAPDAD
jgi:pimeloyl-ACP methyl ester carboxylesterase/uncharacterized protein YndB with AHSA1/START domain